MGFGVLRSSSGKVTSWVFKGDENSVIKHDSDVFVPLHCANNDWLVFLYCFWRSVCLNRLKTLQVSPKRVHLA